MRSPWSWRLADTGIDKNTFSNSIEALRVEVRASGLRAMREKKGLTQRQLARDLGISQNYIPAIEGGARKPGPELMARMVKYFRCDFWELFEVVLLNPETGREQSLVPAKATASLAG